MIAFTVHGVPVPQAGMRSVQTAKGARSISTGGVGLRSWRDDVARAAAAAMHDHNLTDAIDGPLRLTVTFRFPMPKSRRKADRDAGWCWKTTTPDADKLLRAIGDSLKAGGLVRDDSLFVDTHTTKIETTGWTGAEINVSPLHRAWPAADPTPRFDAQAARDAAADSAYPTNRGGHEGSR